jgi:hypothetical protein
MVAVGRNDYKSIDILKKRRFASDILKSKNVSNRIGMKLLMVSPDCDPLRKKFQTKRRGGKDPARRHALDRDPHNLGSFGTDKAIDAERTWPREINTPHAGPTPTTRTSLSVFNSISF